MADRDRPEDEVARLREEIARLRAEAAVATPEPRERTGPWRPAVAGLLVVVAAVLAPISVLATWANGELEDTDRYVETITPLATDPAIQDAVATKLETVLFSHLDIENVTQEVANALSERDLPPRVDDTMQALAPPLAIAIRNFVSDRIDRLVQSDLFEKAWIDANRTAHAQLVAVLSGKGSETVDVTGGTVKVDLAALIESVKSALANEGFAIADRIPAVEASFTVIQSNDLASAQWLFQLLDDVATLLPVIVLILLATAVLIARDRRRTLAAAALAIAGSMLVLGVILNLARPLYLNAIPSAAIPVDAAAAVFDTLVGFIRQALRAVLVVALIVGLAAWLAAPSGAGAALRHNVARGLEWVRARRARAGLSTGPVGGFLYTYRNSVRVVIVGCAAVLYVLQAHPTGATALSFAIVTVLLIGAAEVMATGPSSPQVIGRDDEARR